MTSIEWLIKELYTEMNMSGDGRVLDEILEEAKQMHKKEHGDTWDAALLQGSKRAGNFMRAYEDFDNYYQETFVNNGSDDHISDISKMVEDDVEKLAEINATWDDIDVYSYKLGFKEGYNKAKETLYTEEQVKRAIVKGIMRYDDVKNPMSKEFIDEIIQSLKHKKD